MTLQLHDLTLRGFASDNYAGVHPEVLDAIAAANNGHQIAYGEDVYTAKLQEVVKHHFGEQAEAFPVFNGTGANVLSLQSILPRWGAVVCTTTAHIHTDENAAPERVAGLKLLTVKTPDGKLTPELIDTEAWGWGDEHRAQPHVVSLTQSTELGTVYTPEQIRALADHAHEHGMLVHLDGSRLAYVVVVVGFRFQGHLSPASLAVIRSVSSRATRCRSRCFSTTFSGALAMNSSLPSLAVVWANSFCAAARSFSSRRRSAATSMVPEVSSSTMTMPPLSPTSSAADGVKSAAGSVMRNPPATFK